jgi:hypothetical protein
LVVQLAAISVWLGERRGIGDQSIRL